MLLPLRTSAAFVKGRAIGNEAYPGRRSPPDWDLGEDNFGPVFQKVIECSLNSTTT